MNEEFPINRRDFLKLSGGGLMSTAVFAPTPSQAFPPVTATDYGGERRYPQTCRMCAQTCPVFAVVKNGRVIRMEENRNTPYPAICARGLAAPAALYSPDRVRYPLIRTGERGEGKFRKATWEEALEIVAGKMRSLKEQGDEKAVALLPRFNGAAGLDKEFFKVYGTPNIVGYGDTCFGNSLPLGLASVTGGKKNKLGVPELGTTAISSDYDNAKYGVCVGRNPGGGLVAYTWAAMYGRGRKNGLQVTFVDPRRPSEGGEGPGVDWLPIRPGTDLAFFLGLMNEIVAKKYYDTAYLAKYTNADMLVNVETLQPLSIAENGDYRVYDKASATVTLKSLANEPALRGEYDHDELKVATGFELIARQIEQYTPEWAEGITTVPAASIRKVAARLDEHKPHVFIDRGYRSERYENALKEKHLNIMLNVLLGDFGREGGVFWNRGAGLGHLIDPPKSKDKSLVHLMAKDNPDFSLANLKFHRRSFFKAVLEGKPYKTRMIITWGQNPVGGSAGGHRVIEALNKVDTVVCISPYFNDTTMYADVILPDAIYIERDEAIRAKFKSPMPTLALNRKAMDPLFDVKSGYWIVMQLAKRTLPEEVYAQHFKAFEERGIQALWDAQLAKIDKLDDEEMASFDYGYFLENGVWTGKRKYKVKDKGTPTHTLELYSTFFAETYAKLRDIDHKDRDLAHPLPVWVAPYYMTVRDELAKDEFIPITGFSPLNTFTGAQTKNNPLLTPLMERLNVPSVWINADKGRSLGIEDGDRVEIVNVENTAMKSYARVKLSQLVHPDTMFTAYGVGAGHYTKLSDFLRFAPKDGFNPNHVSNFRFTGLTGGMPSQDFIIKLRKA